MALRNRCTQKLRVSPKLLLKTDNMPAPAVFYPQPSQLGQLNGLSVMSGESTPLSTLGNRWRSPETGAERRHSTL